MGCKKSEQEDYEMNECEKTYPIIMENGAVTIDLAPSRETKRAVIGTDDSNGLTCIGFLYSGGLWDKPIMLDGTIADVAVFKQAHK